MKKVLVDTSVLIDFLRQKDKEKTLLLKLIDVNHTLVISIITYAELFSGKSAWQKKRAKEELKDLLSGLNLILLSEKTSELAGKLRAKYNIGLLDALIAGEAIISQLPLITLNLKDFEKINGLEILDL